jgi:hypothetical protein
MIFDMHTLRGCQFVNTYLPTYLSHACILGIVWQAHPTALSLLSSNPKPHVHTSHSIPSHHVTLPTRRPEKKPPAGPTDKLSSGRLRIAHADFCQAVRAKLSLVVGFMGPLRLQEYTPHAGGWCGEIGEAYMHAMARRRGRRMG